MSLLKFDTSLLVNEKIKIKCCKNPVFVLFNIVKYVLSFHIENNQGSHIFSVLFT